MERLMIVQIVAGLVFLGAGFFGLIRPKRAEDKGEDCIALAGTFSLVLEFILLGSLLLK